MIQAGERVFSDLMEVGKVCPTMPCKNTVKLIPQQVSADRAPLVRHVDASYHVTCLALL